MRKENLIEIIDKSINLVSNDFNLRKKYDFKNIKIVKEYQQIPEIACKRVEIEQVLVNIIRNAAQSIHPDKNKAQIILRCYQNNNLVRIEIEDNGSGMDDKTKKRIFEPFFTTKEVGIGTGLGLSVSYFIITNTHKGEISVESELKKGTKFIIDLPIDQHW
jgi:signal transduction histidine kinase